MLCPRLCARGITINDPFAFVMSKHSYCFRGNRLIAGGANLVADAIGGTGDGFIGNPFPTAMPEHGNGLSGNDFVAGETNLMLTAAGRAGGLFGKYPPAGGVTEHRGCICIKNFMAGCTQLMPNLLCGTREGLSDNPFSLDVSKAGNRICFYVFLTGSTNLVTTAGLRTGGFLVYDPFPLSMSRFSNGFRSKDILAIGTLQRFFSVSGTGCLPCNKPLTFAMGGGDGLVLHVSALANAALPTFIKAGGSFFGGPFAKGVLVRASGQQNNCDCK